MDDPSSGGQSCERCCFLSSCRLLTFVNVVRSQQKTLWDDLCMQNVFALSKEQSRCKCLVCWPSTIFNLTV